MKRWLSFLLCLPGCDRSSGVAGPANPPASTTPAPVPAEPTSIAKGNRAFAFDLWARAAKTPNATLSPASITIALAMTELGARGDTAAQIDKVLHFDGRSGAEAWGKFGHAVSSPARSIKVRVANRLYGEQTYAFEAAFLDKTKSVFGAPLEALDFKKGFEPARAKINGWVEEQTEKRIKNLLPSGALDAETRLVLVNAIYFLADWAEPFEKTATFDAPFDVSVSTKKNVPTMHQTNHFGYAEEPGLKILELPYKGDEASMLVVLPDAIDGLPALEKKLDASKLEALRSALKPSRVAVSLPRFEVSPETMPLASDLAALGMPLAFDREKADFSGMSKPADPRDRLFISKVFHKAFVKVDEKGTEAAAATAVVMARAGSAPQKAIEFKADHPFLFFLIDKPSGVVLFMGRVSDPSTT